MKALSIYAPYADAIATGDKSVEWRSWSTDYRGDVLICSAARRDKAWRNLFITGHAICVATLIDVAPFSPDHHDATFLDDLPDGGYAWILDNVRLIKPFSVKGQQRLFEVDAIPDFADVTPDCAEDYWISLGLVEYPQEGT